MIPNRKVLDLSHHNTVANFATVKGAGIVGIIHKATEGAGYIDPNYAGRKIEFGKVGMLWGAYHFLHPGSISAQVDHFLSVTGVHDDMLYALDWEASTTGTASAVEAAQFLTLLNAKTGRKGVVYSGNVAKEQIKGKDAYFGSHRLWLAQYGSNPQLQMSWKAPWLWQYSDGQAGPQPHGCPGVGGDVDTNSWAGTDDELRQQWSGMALQPPAPSPPVSPPIHPAPTRPVAFAGFCIRGLLSIFVSRAMENLTAEINAKYPGTMQVSDHGYWFSYFSNVGWLTQQCRSIHNNNKKVVLIGHSFGATAAIMVAQALNNQDVPVELLCPIDPASQYPDALVIPPNVQHCVGFFQKTPGQLGEGVDVEGRGWTDAEWKARVVQFQRQESHLAIANDPFTHDTILNAIRNMSNAQ